MKKMIGAFLGVALVCSMLFLAIRGTQPKRIAANVVINSAGRYSSPQGGQIVDVWLEKDGGLKFFVSRHKSDGPSGGGPAASFKADSDWFMCWDSTDRLWTYVPEQDHAYCYYWYQADKGSGSCRVGEHGGWTGVPKSFFDRLPKTVKGTYEAYARIYEKVPKNSDNPGAE